MGSEMCIRDRATTARQALMAWAHAGVRSMVIIILSVIKKRFSQINAQRRVEEVQIDGLALLKLVR